MHITISDNKMPGPKEGHKVTLRGRLHVLKSEKKRPVIQGRELNKMK